MAFKYGDNYTTITDISLSVSGQNPWELKFSGALRPMIFDLIKHEIAPGHDIIPYVVGRIEVKIGGISEVYITASARELVRFTLVRQIFEDHLSFLDEPIEIPERHKLPLASVFYNVGVKANGLDILVKSLNIHLWPPFRQTNALGEITLEIPRNEIPVLQYSNTFEFVFRGAGNVGMGKIVLSAGNPTIECEKLMCDITNIASVDRL